MFRNRVDGPQLQSSGIAVRVLQKIKGKDEFRERGKRKGMGWRKYKEGREGKRRETKADL